MDDLITTKLDPGESAVLRGDKKLTDNIMMLGMGWDPRKTPGKAIDADPTLILRLANGNSTGTKDGVCYFGNPDPSWAHHTGDNITGEGELDKTGDDERMFIDLNKVPAEVTHIDVYAHIYEGKSRGQTFGDLPKGQIRVCNASSMTDEQGAELVRMDLTDDKLFDAVGMLFCQIARKGATWEVKALADANAKFADVNSSFKATSPIQ